jgi:hypothetical protein
MVPVRAVIEPPQQWAPRPHAASPSPTTYGVTSGSELSELGFGESVNRKLVNAAPAGSPPWDPVSV